jgi:hypothetical protein
MQGTFCQVGGDDQQLFFYLALSCRDPNENASVECEES